MDFVEIMNELNTKYWADKTSEAIDLVTKLFDKSISDLENLKCLTSSSEIKKVINLVIQSKINEENKRLNNINPNNNGDNK